VLPVLWRRLVHQEKKPSITPTPEEQAALSDGNKRAMIFI